MKNTPKPTHKKHNYKFFLILLVLGLSLNVCAQNEPDSMAIKPEEEVASMKKWMQQIQNPQKFDFCSDDKNLIQNDSLGLDRFYQKLLDLREGKISQVDIIQIGDSHVQSGFLPAEVRNGLQGFFGDAGRGLVFPYRAVNVNEPYDVSIQSLGWGTQTRGGTKTYKIHKGDTKSGIAHKFGISLATLNKLNPGLSRSKTLRPGRLVTVGHASKTIDAGLCGFALQASANNNSMKIKTRPENGNDGKFAGLTMIVEGPIYRLTVQADSPSGKTLAKTTIVARDDNLQTVSLYWDELVTEATIKFKGFAAGKYVTLYGMTLEKNTPGIMYHTIAMNGAGFAKYGQNEDFFTQLNTLQPDLLIVSLGTNDAMGVYNDNVFKKNVSDFIKALEAALPDAEVLLSIPPDCGNFTQKKVLSNTAIPKIEDNLIKAAMANDYAYWDLYTVMGGNGAMKNWSAKGLSDPDLKHFSMPGYQLQGKFLRDAILKGYISYVERLAR